MDETLANGIGGVGLGNVFFLHFYSYYFLFVEEVEIVDEEMDEKRVEKSERGVKKVGDSSFEASAVNGA